MSYWIYGKHTVHEVLLSNSKPQKVLIAQGVHDPKIQEIIKLANRKKVTIEFAPKKIFETRFQGNHQGIAIFLESMPIYEFKSFFSAREFKNEFVCMLDEIQDPQNLGSMIRSAVCLGCTAIILPTWRSASLTETVIRASSGAAAHIPIIEIANLTVAIDRLKEKGFFIYGADVDHKNSLHNTSFSFPMALILGNEQRGIKPILKNMCDQLITIPQAPQLNSLNVGCAAAVFFYEIHKQLTLKNLNIS